MSQGSKAKKQDELTLQILDRIQKLCFRPQHPGLAYQSLATIDDLVKVLREHLDQ